MDVEEEVKLDQNDALMDSERKPGERFLGITEWFPRIGGNEYHMLVMNTMLTRAKNPLVGSCSLQFLLGPAALPCSRLRRR